MTVGQRLGTFVLVLTTTAGATFMVLFAPGSGSLEAQPIRVIYDVMAAVILLPWLAIGIVRPSWRPTSRLLPALLVALAAFAISSTTSRVPRLSFEMLGYAVLLAELYVLLVALMRLPAIRVHLERLALLFCLIVSVLYLAQVAQAWIEWWGLVGRFAIPPLRPGYLGLQFGSPNPVATLVLMLGAFGLATSQVRGRRGWAAAAAIVGLIAVATFLTGSRGAWLGVVAGLVAAPVVAVLALPVVRERARSLARSRRGAVAVAIAAPVFVAAGLFAAVSGRLTLEDGGLRAAFARASLAMFESSPATGVGPGMWGVTRATYTAATDVDYYIPHAHNLYMQTLAEFGIVGLLAGILAVGVLAKLIGRAIRSNDRSRRNVAFAALFAVVLLSIQQLADVLVNVPALLLGVGLPIAWLDAREPSTTRSPHSPSSAPAKDRVIAIGMAVITCAIFAGLLRIEAAAGLARQGTASANSGAWLDASRFFGEATVIDPGISMYQFERGLSAANAGDLALAESSLSLSAAADDYPFAWLNLADIRRQLGDGGGAAAALARAERLGLQRPTVAIASGWLHEQLDQWEAAIDAYARVILRAPYVVNDPFWFDPERAALRVRVLEAVDERADPATKLQIQLMLGQVQRARDEVDALEPTEAGLFLQVIDAWDGGPEAWESLQAAAEARPLDAGLARWCRFIAVHRGDAASVERYGRWLIAIGVPDSAPALPGPIIVGSSMPLPPAFLDRYGSTYRRELLDAQVVRTLPQLTWPAAEAAR